MDKRKNVMKKIKKIAISTMFICNISALAAVINVAPDNSADYSIIQDAVNAASNFDTVILAPGIYNQRIFYNAKKITITSQDPNDLDIVKSTIIQYDSAPAVTFDFSETSDSVLTGLTIKGSVKCYASSPAITKNIITDSPDSAIIGSYFAAPTINQNTIQNAAAQAILDCDGLISSNLIKNNKTGIEDCDGIIFQNQISSNSGPALKNCSGTVMMNLITKNTAINGAGLLNCKAQISNNVIAANIALENGAAAALCTGTIKNNTIVGNYAHITGAAVYDCNTVIENNILAYNRAALTAGIHGPASCNFNCFWAHLGANFADGAIAGPNDFVADPMFVDSGQWQQDVFTTGDYHLKSQADTWNTASNSWKRYQTTSPCIDAGNPQDSTAAELYPDGNVINLGAFGGTPYASRSINYTEPVCAFSIPSDVNGDCKADLVDISKMSVNYMKKVYKQSHNTYPFYLSIKENKIVSLANAESKNSIYFSNYYSLTEPDTLQTLDRKVFSDRFNYYQAKDITTDSVGNTCGLFEFTRNSHSAVKIFCFAPNGTVVWQTEYLGQQDNDIYPQKILTHTPTQTVYVLARSEAQDTRAILIKYDCNGSLLWSRQLAPGTYPRTFALDNSADVYIVVSGSADSVLKYSSAGNFQWSASLGFFPDQCMLTPDNHIVYAGTNGSQIVTARCDTAGNIKWTAFIDPQNTGNFVHCLITDSESDIYLAAETFENPCLIAAYDRLGNQLFEEYYQMNDQTFFSPKKIVKDPNENLYVLATPRNGRSELIGSSSAVISYNASGSLLWSVIYESHVQDKLYMLSDMAFDSGKLYTAGWYMDNDPCDIDQEIVYAEITVMDTDSNPLNESSFQGIICTAFDQGDTNGDCIVSISDFLSLASEWLNCNLEPAGACSYIFPE